MTNIATEMTAINPDTLIGNATGNVVTVQQPDNVQVGTSLQAEIEGLYYQEAADKAARNANRYARVTWMTEMIIERICDLGYDIRALTGDFAGVELEYAVTQVGTVAVYTVKHYATDTDATKANKGVKKVSSTWAVEPEVYYEGQHDNGDPVKRMRYRARQLGSIDRKALLMSSNAGLIKALESIQRKESKGKALSGFERDLKATLTAKGYVLADLLTERASAVNEAEHGHALERYQVEVKTEVQA